MAKEFPKTYSPSDIEDKWRNVWQKNNIYAASEKSDKKPYSILMPPPNITGMLHFGHVLNNSLQDVYIRHKRMHGYEACWFPGYDHAGIATQARVEKELKNQGTNRHELGREKFLEQVWKWKDMYGGIILQQLRQLGISCDWDRLLFTLEEGASKAVQDVFIRLFDEGLIYKGKRIINWSPLSLTALSDEEVEFREVQEHLYTLRYKYVGTDEYLCVATVRPETIFGDVAIAVNPNDDRFKDKIGKKVLVPIINKEIEIIADDYADPKFGTGCVKITPAHDPNDFEVGLRHNLPMPNAINPDATLNELAGEFQGMERFAARKAVLKKLKELDLIEKIENYTHNVGFSQRGGEAVEPYLSDQWFVSMKPLAEPALKAVQDGEIRFYPNHWVKTFEHWMTGIRDWCISRQLWWGHRIPVYYAPDGRFTAARDEAEACKKMNLPEGTPLTQDPDVLDTWFSSWLWPMTTMNWLADGKTEDNEILSKFLPTDLMVTAPDIIFFWVARMIMATLKFRGQIPFKDVYFTSLIRDGEGRKLSKSLGNSPDPLNVIQRYGTDAVRFTMLYLSPLGQDVRMDVNVETQDIPSMELGRNFANKIWNAGRFLIMKRDMILENDGNHPLPLLTKEGKEEAVIPANAGIPLSVETGDSCMHTNDSKDMDSCIRRNDMKFSNSDKWILSRFHHTIERIETSLTQYKVNDYSKILYDFIWRDFCDWYIEILKVEINNCSDVNEQIAHINFAIEIYGGILSLLHPVMPFISEEIWHIINNFDEDTSLSLQKFPEAITDHVNSDTEIRFELLQNVVEEIRKLRAQANIQPNIKLPVSLSIKENDLLKFFEGESELVAVLAKCSAVNITEQAEKPAISLNSVVREVEIFVETGGTIDIDKERERLQKELERLERNISGTNAKLGNEKFVANAKPEIVDFERKKLIDLGSALVKVKENLAGLG
ncbi:MAG: valine--tRNA ligase [Candidatus Kapabacteria bacterium]|nr:valine--tRNA ligase [Candidatus Kapabacteria bacterium]